MNMKNTDKNLQLNNGVEKDIIWFNPQASDQMRIYGFAWFDYDRLYRRLPAAATKLIRNISPYVDNLADHTAGGQLHFRTDSDTVLIDVKLKEPNQMARMTAAAQGGFDCYVGSNYHHLKFYSLTTFPISARSYRYEFFTAISGDKLIIINFPLYNKVENLKIGIRTGAVILPPESVPNPGRIVVYGTSITQGACASRPGLSYTNILSRRLGTEFINLGFSGNAFGEPEIAGIISNISDVKLFILDYEANAGTNGKLYLTLEAFILTIRKVYPTVDIAVVSRIKYLFDELNSETLGRVRQEIKDFQIGIVEKLRHAGDSKIHFIDGAMLLGDDYYECTVDSIHPNDIGFYRIASGLEKAIRKILKI